jgi:hypothetical protein
MKPILILLIILSSFNQRSFACGENDIPCAAMESFNRAFAGADEATWTNGNGFAKVVFTIKGQYITAFYTNEGELIALTRNLLSNQLPLLLQSSLKNNYSCYWITDLFEWSSDDEICYYVTLENAEGKIILKSSNNNWTFLKKIKP